AYATLHSLPRIFNTTLETIPAKIPYLRAETGSVESWQHQLSDSKELKVGLAWQGNPRHTGDRFRSIPFAMLMPLTEVPVIRLFSLQKGFGREQLTALHGQTPIVDLAERLCDLAETAALVSTLDLVITCDSAPAHLAGALGIPVWVALSLAP